ncbi:MAG: hypothetical protein ABSB41_05720 [Anaerolineales bacterium]|jgi:hypothetical protein
MKKEYQPRPSQTPPIPYSVSTLNDLPPKLHQAALQAIEPTDKLRSICVFPGRTRLKTWYRSEYAPEQALLFTNNGIHDIQAPASPHQDARNIFLRATDLLYVRLHLQLMYGCLELVDDRLSRSVVEFDATGFDILQGSLQDLLGAACGGNSVSTPQSPPLKTILSELEKQSFKFKNGLYLYGLLPDEHLFGFVFQPSIWGRRWHLFPLREADTTLLALTDKQFIVVEEQSQSRFPAYGWIFTFCPRRAIDKIEVTPNGQWQDIRVEMKGKAGGIDRRILLEPENVLAWGELWSRFGDPGPAAST